MTIHIVRSERELRVFDALLQIARCDPGLITYSVGLSLYVDYVPKQPSTKSSKRLLELTSHKWPIFVAGVGSGYLNTVNGKPIINSGGGISLPYSTQTNIFVDVEDAFGQHYRDIDVDRKTIYSPLPLILYHELAHAYHEAIEHDAPADVPGKEVQARKDENEFRDQLKLPLEHPTDYWSNDVGKPSHGGVTFVTCQAAGGYSNPWANCRICSIASAALGSPAARQIVAFRRAKRDFEALTFGSVPILQPMLSAYELFGPRVAGQMYDDPVLRKAVLDYGVQPAAQLLHVVETYLSTTAGARRELEFERSLGDYVDTVRADALADVAAGASDASRILAGHAVADEARRELPRSVFVQIADAVLRTHAETHGPTWILDGLALFLRAAAGRAAGTRSGSQLADAIGAWLARVPIPTSAQPDVDLLRADLVVLRDRLFPEPANRVVFAARVLSRWPQSAPALRTLLEETRYIESNRVEVYR